jgi:hypothetical protein
MTRLLNYPIVVYVLMTLLAVGLDAQTPAPPQQTEGLQITGTPLRPSLDPTDGFDPWRHHSGSDIPRWTIAWQPTLTTASGLQFGAGFFGRRGDPLPLYLSERSGLPVTALDTVAGPGTYTTQWDVRFTVSAPLLVHPGLDIRAIGDIYIPLARQTPRNEPGTTILGSPAFRLGLATRF